MKKWIFLFSIIVSIAALANDNSCDDYLQRHYKKDLTPTRVSYQNKTHIGDIAFPHQQVKLTLKNIGQVDFNPISSDSGVWRNIYIKINGITKFARFQIPLDSGLSTAVYFNLPPNTLKHCRNYEVEIDLEHTARQWGCQVWNNDKKTMKAYIEKFRFCSRVIIKPPRFPRL